MKFFSRKAGVQPPMETTYEQEQERERALVDTPHKSTLKKVFPVMAAGSGLFSDGYLNNVSPVREICIS